MTPIIVGAGVGGLATALALKRIGVESRVLERADAFREVGAGLLIAPRAVAVLRRLGLYDAILARAHATTEWKILDARGRILSRIKLSSPALSLHRSDLLDVFRQSLPEETIQLGSAVRSLSTKYPDTIEVALERGTTLTTNAVIGADGIRSRVRTHFTQRRLTYRGYIGWRGIAPFRPAGYSENWLSESWGGGKRFGIAAISGGRCYWYASANVPEGYESPSADRKGDLLERFHDWHAPICELIASTHDNAVLADPIRDNGIGSWPKLSGPVTLLGDAAHSMTPNLGQGACQALEDAEALAAAWAKAGTPTAAFRAYENTRRRRTAFVQATSLAGGWIVQLQNPALTACRDLALRITPDAISTRALRPILEPRSPR